MFKFQIVLQKLKVKSSVYAYAKIFQTFDYILMNKIQLSCHICIMSRLLTYTILNFLVVKYPQRAEKTRVGIFYEKLIGDLIFIHFQGQTVNILPQLSRVGRYQFSCIRSVHLGKKESFSMNITLEEPLFFPCRF